MINIVKAIKNNMVKVLLFSSLILIILGALLMQQKYPILADIEREIETERVEQISEAEEVDREADVSSGMVKVAENDYLILYINNESTEIAVKVKSTGSIWHSSSPTQGSEGTAKEIISMIYDRPEAIDQRLSSFDHSVKLGQHEIHAIKDGVRIEFFLGERYDMNRVGVPQMIKRERFESLILDRIEDPFRRELLLDSYTMVSLTKPYDFEIIKDTEMAKIERRLFGEYILVSNDEGVMQRRTEIAELDKEIELLEEAGGDREGIRELSGRKDRLVLTHQRERMQVVWGVLEKYVGFVLGGGKGARIASHRRGVEGLWDLDMNDFFHLIENPTYVADRLPPLIIEEIQHILAEIGYTIEDHKIDHFQNRLDPPKAELGLFMIPIEFTLDDDNLVVRIPSGEIEYPRDVPVDFRVNFEANSVEDAFVYNYTGARMSFPVHKLNVLKYFGAAPSNPDDYIFVPDGSGALIAIDGRHRNLFVYNKQVYGLDKSIPTQSRLANVAEMAHFPVFGIKQGDRALFAIIEEGEALANVRVNLAQNGQTYNMVFPVFSPVPFWDKEFRMYQNRIYQGDFVIRYAFLEGENASYVGMARYYQNYLVEIGTLRKRDAAMDSPFYVELLGAIHKRRPVFGVPRNVYYPLTTVEQAKEIVRQLVDAGVNNIRLRYSGWLKGGLHHHYPRDARMERVLGTREELIALNNFLKMNGGVLYPDVSFLQVYNNNLFDGFNASRDASRDLSGMPARDREFNVVTLMPDDRRYNYILSPSRLFSLMRDFLNSYQKELGIQALSLNRMGEEINSDFRREEGKTVDRQQAAEIIESFMYELNNHREFSLMIEGGNANVLAYAKDIVNMPMACSDHYIVSRTVPFMQIVLRGFVDFAGRPLNLSNDYREDFLRAVEVGANLNFKWIHREPSILKGTEFDYLLDVHYENWLEKAVELYQSIDLELGHLQGLPITDHVQLQEGISMTTFGYDYRVIVNYRNQPVDIKGITIDSRNFGLLRGAGE